MNFNKRWQLAGRSVRGASHAHSGLPNQDALQMWSRGSGGAIEPCAAAAVADGHGGHRHFRSDIGARIAVDIAIRAMRSMAPMIEALPIALREPRVQAELPQMILGEWVSQVRVHLASNPIRDEEWTTLQDAEGAQAADSVRDDPLLAYGATLLAALVTSSSVVLLQLGDGDVLGVWTDGTTSRPLPGDERLNGNLTTSICRPGAESDFRIAVLERDRSDPALLLLSTDGYANSFRTDEDFLRVGADFAALIARHGLKAVDAQLESILSEASAKGSGDDITLVILQRDNLPLPHDSAPWTEQPADTNRPELEAAQRQIRRLRTALGAAVLAVIGLALWHVYPEFVAHGWPKTDIALHPAAPLTPARDPGLAGSAPTANDPTPLTGIPLDGPKGPKERAASADRDAAQAVTIDHAHAFRANRGIQISASVTPAPQVDACTVRAAVWGEGDKELGAASAGWSGRSTSTELTLLVPYPADKSSQQSMRSGSSQFSVRIDCGGRTVGKTERLAVDA